jgi:hypothetical protein
VLISSNQTSYLSRSFTKEFISKASLLKNLPWPPFAKEGFNFLPLAKGGEEGF